MLSNEKHPHLVGLAHEIAAILADILIKDVRTELTNLAQRAHQGTPLRHCEQSDGSPELRAHTLSGAPRTLWSLKELALDSGIKVSTWRRWILERRISCVRIGRSVRIPDEEYRKLIQQGYRKAIR